MKNTTLKNSNLGKNLKQWYYACMVLCLSVTGTWAQGTIPIGSGTANDASLVPINSCYGYNYTQQIVKASEYANGGGAAGNITKVRFYYASGGTTFANWANWTVYVGHTAKTEFTSNTDWEALSNLTQVYSGAVTPVAGNWMEITFTTPFNYNGTSNLIVAIDENVTNWSCTAAFGSYIGAANTAIYYRADSTNPDPATPPTATGRTSTLARIQFEGILATCLPPTGLNITALTSATATVNWTASTSSPASGYEYYLSPTNTAPTAATPATDDVTGLSTVVSGLAANTPYYVWVRSNCGGGDMSAWNGPVQFTTLCDAATLTYTNGFNAATIPSCWSRQHLGIQTGTKISFVATASNKTAAPQEGTHFVNYNSYSSTNGGAGAEERLISPPLTSTGISSVDVEFFWFQNNGPDYAFPAEGVTVEWSTNGGTTWNSETYFPRHVATASVAGDWVKKKVTLPAGAGNQASLMVALKFHSEWGYNMYVDNFTVKETPQCAVPTLTATTNITKNSATINWTAPDTGIPTSYEYVVTETAGTPAGAGTNETDLTVDLTSLDPSTLYYVYVRTVCTDIFSEWTIAGTFMTLCDYGDILSTTGDSVCGQGEAELSATVSPGGVLTWYAAETGGAALATGDTYTTPLLTETTDFYVSGGNLIPGSNVQVGAGTSTDYFAGYSPYYNGYGGTKTQYIYRASELQAAGISAGPINSLAFNISSLSTPSVNLNSFAVSIGTTSQNAATTTHIDGLTPVYANASQAMTTGWNTYTFDTPFVWDGTSNIVVQVCFSNNNGGNSSSYVYYSSTSFTGSTYSYSDNQTPATICAIVTGTPGNGGTYTASVRANTMFNATAICESARVMVTAEVTDAPDVEVSASEMAICNGESTTLSVESANAGYTYMWTPGDLSGAEQTVSPTETTTYTVTATDETTECVEVAQITITVNPLPSVVVGEDDFAVCEGGMDQLSATGGLVVMTELSQSFDAAASNFATGGSAGTPSANANTTYFAEGSGSVLFNTASTNANVNYAMNADVDLTDYATAQLTFSHIVAFEGTTYSYDIGYVEYSADGGANWTTFPSSSYAGSGTLITTQGTATPVSGVIFSTKSYPAWLAQFDDAADTPGTGPATNLWRSETINIPASALTSQFRVRFRITTDVSVNYYGWLIDNLQIIGESQNIVWSPVAGLYTDEAGTVAYAGENMPTVYVKPTSNTTYTATATTALGCSVSDEVAVSITVIPAPAAAATQSFCAGATVADLATTDAEVVSHWYYSAVGGAQLADTTPLLDGTPYFVSQTVDGCESVARTMVTATVITTPAPEAGDDVQTFCNAATLADVMIDGENIMWYTVATGGEAVAADMALEEGISLFFASQTVDGCESPMRTAVAVELNVTDAPMVADDAPIFCNSATIADIEVDGDDVMWYDAAEGGTMLSADTALMDGGMYYASQTVNGCESAERTMVSVTINAPEAPTGDDTQEFCFMGTVGDLIADGAAMWYDASEGGNLLSGDTALVDGMTYYASQVVDGCESIGRFGVTVTITVVEADAPENVFACYEYTLPELTNGNYYTDSNGAGEMLAAGTVITETTTLYVYYVGATELACSDENTFTIVIGNALSPTGDDTQEFELEVGEEVTIADLEIVTEGIGTVAWYASDEDAATGENPLSADTVLVDGMTYYATFTVGDCTSEAFAVMVDVALGRDGFDASAFTYYPNPVTDVLNMSYSSEISSVEVFNMLGQKVMAIQPNATEVKLNMASLSDATYIVNVTSGDSVQTIKVVKKQ